MPSFLDVKKSVLIEHFRKNPFLIKRLINGLPQLYQRLTISNKRLFERN
ncbi:hypothetical protein [Fredinandcohnia onubensis]|nr:hypothetical protein [Fredinandcohnia onubensis]